MATKSNATKPPVMSRAALSILPEAPAGLLYYATRPPSQRDPGSVPGLLLLLNSAWRRRWDTPTRPSRSRRAVGGRVPASSPARARIEARRRIRELVAELREWQSHFWDGRA